jgi:tRNA threonylcarbamoyl adenosine modification protein YeaZ
MLLLLDTSTRTAVVALADAGGTNTLGEHVYVSGAGGSSLLLDGARELLADAGVGLGAVTGLVLNRGPGSYTGLRVGYALAQGLSESRRLPIAGIPSFLALAAEHRTGTNAFVVCFDAKSRGIAWITFAQGEVEPQRWREGKEHAAGLSDALELGEELIEVRFAPAEAVPGLISRPCQVAGPGVSALLGQLQDSIPDELDIVEGSERPSTRSLLRLGSEALQAGATDPTTVAPLYLGTIAPPKPRTGR